MDINYKVKVSEPHKRSRLTEMGYFKLLELVRNKAKLSAKLP